MTDPTAHELSPVKRALQEVREMRAKLEEMEHANHEPIAVIGMACRYPGGVNNLDDFWRLLSNRVDAITEIPKERWDIDSFYDPDPDAGGKIATRWGGFLDQVDEFDAPFFGISAREAEGMDPQHRLLLEVAWEALEAACQAPDKFMGSRTGVFIGISSLDYYQIMAQQDPNDMDVYFAQGTTHSVAAGRISYFLGLQGPAISVDTACSSSLVAIHLAAQSLRSGESNMALVGGVNAILQPETHISFSKAHMLSRDGRCKTFDARADGYVRSEGCGMVVLKRLSEALADGDNILAVIRGSAVNQDGRSNGLTAPNGVAQERVIRVALSNAQVDPLSVSYVEAHGTGTSLGDPIEVQALGSVYGMKRSEQQRLKIGSVKTNLGHLEAAAGIAALMKAVLILQHKQIPPSLHFETPNPYIPWDQLPIDVATKLSDLPAYDGKYLVGVSSFGFSGTNSHVILEAAPELFPKTADVERPLQVLKLSAKDKAALQKLVEQFVANLENQTAEFENICFTANAGRADLTHRIALVASSGEEARTKLAAHTNGKPREDVFGGTVFDTASPEVVFLFTGHGSQYSQMSRGLFETQPTFSAALSECTEILKSYLDVPLLEILFPQDNAKWLDTMTYGQPALFAVEYALAQLWMSWGVKPATVLGHSVGEYVAACIAGVFSLEDGLKMVSARGRLMDSLPVAGEMVAVFAEEATVNKIVAPYDTDISIAVINGPTNIVISGGHEVLKVVTRRFEELGIKTRQIAVTQAAHSHFLDPILDEFESVAATIRYSEPRLGFVSCLTGRFAEADKVTNAKYWRRHLRQPVRFADGMRSLYAEGYRHFIEIGPNPVLSGMAQRIEGAEGRSFMPSLRQGWQDWQQILESVAALYTRGITLDWKAFDKGYHRRYVSLPTYPWTRQRYWAATKSQEQFVQPQSPQELWQIAVKAGEYEAERGPLDLAIESHPARWDCLNRLAIAYMVQALRQMDVFTKSDDAFSVDHLLAQGHIHATYRGLMSRWLAKLSEAGWIEEETQGQYIARKPLSPVSPDSILQEARTLYTDGSYLPDYMERCGRALVNILRGVESPLDTLFPAGSYETANYLYHHSAIARYFNGIARAILEASVMKQSPGKQIRIVEVGGGTGGTTTSLLPVLPGERTDYRFTDVSEYFFKQAEQKFEQYPFIRYGLMDIEKDPEEQGYNAHNFDFVIGANVFHATKNLDKALMHARSLLAPGGMLLLYETTAQPTWFETSIGLIEGWSRFDDEWRRDIPLLSAQRWAEALQANGFVSAASWPRPGMVTEVLGSHILLAQAPLEIEFDPTAENQISNGKRAATSRTPSTTQYEEPKINEAATILLQQLAEATSEERQLLLIDYVRDQIMRVTRSDASNPPDRRQRLMDFGVDSLMAVDLRNRLSKGIGLTEPLPATLIFDYPTIERIAGYLEGKIKEENGTLPSNTSLTDISSTANNIAELSDEEVEKLLMKKLGDMS